MKDYYESNKEHKKEYDKQRRIDKKKLQEEMNNLNIA